jgi:hypothetical protein
MIVANERYSIKLEGTQMTEKTGEAILNEFVVKKFKLSPFFKVLDIKTKFYECYQTGSIVVYLGWRFRFSEKLFRFFGGELADE